MTRSTTTGVLSWGSFVVAVIGVLVALSLLGLGYPLIVSLILGFSCLVVLEAPLVFFVLLLRLSASGRVCLLLATAEVAVYLSAVVAPGGLNGGRHPSDGEGGVCSQLITRERPDLTDALNARNSSQPSSFSRRWMPAELVCQGDLDGRPRVILHTGAKQT